MDRTRTGQRTVSGRRSGAALLSDHRLGRLLSGNYRLHRSHASFAKGGSRDTELLERARRMLDWLVSIQMPAGGFQRWRNQ